MNNMSKETKESNPLIAVIRLRSSIGLRQESKETLSLLNLSRVNHAVVLDKRPTYLGMFQKAKDAVFENNDVLRTQWKKFCRRERQYTWPSRPVLFDKLEEVFIRGDGLLPPVS